MTMDMMPENALVISHSDSMQNGLFYYQHVEKYRTDIDLIDGNMLLRHWWLINNRPFHPTVKFPKTKYGNGLFKAQNMTDIVRAQLEFCELNRDRQIFICGNDQELFYMERIMRQG